MNISEAEKQIMLVLKQLEIDTGSVVDSLCIKDVEVTSFRDEREQIKRCVTIELKRIPGTKWSV